MLRIALLTVGLLLVGAARLAAQQSAVTRPDHELRGRVLDAQSGSPLGSAIVRLPAVGLYTLTDPAGRFGFTAVRQGTHVLEVLQLGYGEQRFEATIRSDTFLELRVRQQAVRLDSIVVDSRVMHRTAQRRAQHLGLGANLRRRAIFWDAYDRDRILASGISDPLEFLDDRRGANLSLRECAGYNVPRGRLCLRVPFVMRGPSLVIPRVYLDDRRVALEELRDHVMEDIGRVEAFGMRGEEEIRLYTNGYLRLVELGVVTPNITPLPLFDVYRGPGMLADSVYRPPVDTTRHR